MATKIYLLHIQVVPELLMIIQLNVNNAQKDTRLVIYLKHGMMFHKMLSLLISGLQMKIFLEFGGNVADLPAILVKVSIGTLKLHNVMMNVQQVAHLAGG